jgi:hypothetical protein
MATPILSAAGVESSLLNSTTSWHYSTLASYLLRPATVRRGKLEGVQTILEMALPVTLSGCEAPRVPMVEPTHPRQGYKGAMTRFPSPYRPDLGRVLPHSIVDPIRMIVGEVFTNQPSQVGFIEHHHVIQQFSAAVPHPCLSPKVDSLGKQWVTRARE